MERAWSFHTAGNIVFGRGAVARLGKLVQQMGLERALVVTDKAIVQAGLLSQVISSLVDAGVAAEVFDGGEPEPSLSAVNLCVKQAKEAGAQVLVGLGGGSNIDLAKAASVLLKHGGSARKYLGEDKVPGPIWPLVAVPTTAGTGSEVSGASVLADKEQNVRGAILSNFLRPLLALVDPLLTLTCPPKVTADAGMDALTHAIEAYLAIDFRYMDAPADQLTFYSGRTPLTDCLALEAIRLIGGNIRLAVHQGRNLEAREKMHLASLLAGMAFSNAAVALVHALEYPIGVMTSCTHGAGNALLLPYVMRYNLPTRMRELAEVAAALGEDVDGLVEREAAELAVDAVQQLKEDVGIPMRLRELGMTEGQISEAAQQVVGNARLMRNNPRPATAAQLAALLQEAF